MKKEVEIVTVQATPAMTEYIEAGPATESQPNPLATCATLLRGRVWPAVVLALLLGAGLAFLGFRFAPVEYQSTGIVQIRPYVRQALPGGDQNGILPSFDAYIDAQVQLLQAQRTIDYAIQNSEWQRLGRGATPDAEAEYTKGIAVEHDKGSEIIKVEFADKTPQAAMAGAQALLSAYQALYNEGDGNNPEQLLPALEERRTMLNNQLKDYEEKILVAAKEYGSNSLEEEYRFKLSQLNDIEKELKQAQILLARSTEGGEGASQAATGSMIEITAEAGVLQKDMAHAEEIRDTLEQLRSRFGEKYPQVTAMSAELDRLDQSIAQRTEKLRHLAGGLIPGGSSSNFQTPGQLKAAIAALQTLYDATRTATLDLGRKNVTILAYKDEADTLKKSLLETKQRIDQLNLEAAARGRMTILSADRPLEAHKDHRKSLAAAGGALGCGMGIGLFLLIGLMDRRLRFVDDAAGTNHSAETILGVLPVLPRDLSDPEEAATAAYCVHQIRAMLQIQRRLTGHRVYAVTSPAAGDGKTSLVIALGLSFAASGSKTLLVDCDMVGGALSDRMARISRRKIGRILMNEGLVTEPQLKESLRLARQSRQKLGEVLVDQGFVTGADVDHAMTVQTESTVGLRDLLAGEKVEECITGTGIANLFLLPLGGAGTVHVGQLSPAVIREIVDSARKDFDTILFDTGPILGSLEAAVVAAEVDRVVTVLSRGEQRPLAERALEHIKSTGARVAGIVFNRARLDDIVSSGYSSLSQRSVRRLEDGPRNGDAPRLGPIGTAVASSTVSRSQTSKA